MPPRVSLLCISYQSLIVHIALGKYLVHVVLLMHYGSELIYGDHLLVFHCYPIFIVMVVIVILGSCKKVKLAHMGDEPYTHVYVLYPFDEAVYLVLLD